MNSRQIQRAINDAGFRLLRENGGHVTYSHPDGRTFSMPDLRRSGERRALDSGNSIHLLRSMLRRAGVVI